MDLSRSYPRGTWARYENGLIRSYRDTLPGEAFDKSGWETIVAGVASCAHEQDADDPRIVRFRAKLTGGPAVVDTFRVPFMLYRDIYERGKEYAEGDVVTWGGSLWCCRAERTTATPGTDGDWRLIVKEGRRGKDGGAGPAGPQGPAGRPGKDYVGGES